MSLPSSGNGWQCPSCKTWINFGQFHNCTSYTPQNYTPQNYTYQPYFNPEVLERIAKALETIALQLTESSTYERDGLLFCKNCGSGLGAVDDNVDG